MLSTAAAPAVLDRNRAAALVAAVSAARAKRPTGFLKAAEAINATTIRVQFRTPISRQLASGLRYEVQGLQVLGTQLARDGRGAVLTTTPQDGNGYQLRVSMVRGQGGRARVLKQGTAPFVGKPAPRVTDVTPVDDTTIVVTYDRPMSQQAAQPQNYALTDQSGQQVRITGAEFLGSSSSQVKLQTAPQSYGSYSFNVYNVTDTAGQQVFFEGRKLTGNPRGAVLSVAATSPTTVVVAFNEPMADNALAPQHYNIRVPNGPQLRVTDARFDGPLGMVVVLTTEAQSAVGYQLFVSNVTDLQLDALSNNTGTFQGIAAPALAGAVATQPTRLVLNFTGAVGDSALAPSSYRIEQLDAQGNVAGTLPVVGAAFVGGQRTVVELATEAQADARYRVRTTGALTDVAGTPLPASNVEFRGNRAPDESPETAGPPRVVGAASLSNTEVIVSFSEPMADNAKKPEHYVITQENVNSEAGALLVTAAEFYQGNRSVVKLTTRSQNELTYRVTVVNATDLVGNALAQKVVNNGVLIDPTSATFPGTPASGDALVDSDDDGLTDNEEQRGWLVRFRTADGHFVDRMVTSDIHSVDSDGDGFTDDVENQLKIDPRDTDTDDDLLSDWEEYTEIFCDHLNADTDLDGVDDGTEFLGVRSSPLFADSDGDQIADGTEIALGGSYNVRVANLPAPKIEVGDVNLQLDVRFTETNEQERRDLETRQVATTLSSSTSRTLTRSDSVNFEVHLDAGYEPGAGGRGGGFINGGFALGYNWQYTDESAAASQREYQDSLSTDKEVTRGFSVERQVVGAVMQVGISLRNAGNQAFRVKNLQVTAFIQDPLDRTKLTPVATLLPDSEPEEGFTLGPLVTSRGPFIFSNTTIVPSLVESLMANSAGLIFRIANYDIVDEAGRNFAFSSQEVASRTSALIIDYGGARSLRAQVSGEPVDENQPGDETEIHRVVLGAGRPVADTNGDGKVDLDPNELFDSRGNSLGIDADGDGKITDADATYVPDRRITFDLGGTMVGISVRQAFAAAGLRRYVEATTPTANLTDDQVLNSYSVTVDAQGRERIFRIRGVANDTVNRKFWEVLTTLGVDPDADLNALILNSYSPISFGFVQDLDRDGLTADVEYFLRTSDSPDPVGPNDPTPRGRDTDRDGLDDRFEALIGWTVTTPQRTYQVWSSPNRADSNFDDPPAAADPGNKYDGSDAFAAPAGWTDRDGDGLRDRLNEVFQQDPVNGVPDYVLDPIRRDTDGDGIDDAQEVVGFTITRITDGRTLTVSTNPLNPDTDGDTFSDGFEKQVGLNPNDGNDLDTDGDGLPDPVEDTGWDVTTIAVSTSPFAEGAATTKRRTSSKNDVDSDDDGLTDFEEFFLGSNALSGDTDGDGIADLLELRGFTLPHKVGDDDLGIIRTKLLDADTDNDKRSDGAEAELIDVELARWVVRVVGQDPRQVFSNPLVADADFDSLVDGDEFTVRTDPNVGNSDGDTRDDGTEVREGTNPLVEDFRVTVFFSALAIVSDGDGGGAGPGDFGFDLGVRRPDGTQPAGLSSQLTSVIQANADLTAPFRTSIFGGLSDLESRLPPWDGVNQQSLRNNGAGIYGINITDGDTLFFNRYLPENLRSVSFGMTTNDFFAVEGVVLELDGFTDDGNPLNDSLTYVYLGGLEGAQATENSKAIRPVFYGGDLLAGPRFRDLTFTFTGANNQEFGGGGQIAGFLTVLIIVG